MSRPSRTAMLLTALILSAQIGLAAIPAVSNAANTILYEMGNPGTASAVLGHFNGPFGVATDELGNVYVLERLGQRVQKFDSRGNFVLGWGSAGSGNGQFNAPSFIAVDAGHVFVTDSGNNRVQVFDTDGIYELKWGTFGTANGQFDGPNAIAVDPLDHSVYVTEWSGNRVQRFSSTGNHLATWGSSGSGNGQFANPSGIAVDHGGRVFVADQTHRMQKFTHDGNYMTTWGAVVFNTNGLAIDAVGNLYVAGFAGHDVKKYSADGTLLETIGPSLGSYAFGNPIGVAVDPCGNLYVTFLDRHTVLKLSPLGGQTSDAPPLFLTQSTLINPGAESTSLVGATFASGTVYVADTANDQILFKFYDNLALPWGVMGSPGSGLGQLSSPTGLAVSQSGPVAGSLYVADTENNRIQMFNSSHIPILMWGSVGSGNGQFLFPMGVAIDRAGDVYVADTFNNRIQKFNNTGGYLMKWGGLGSLPGQFNQPMGIALDATDHLYVADRLNNRVQKFTRDGVLMGQIKMSPNPGTGNGQFDGPTAVAVDSFGDVCVTDMGNHRVQKFTQSGFYLTQWGTPGSAAGQFNSASGLAVDAVGTVYVVDTPPLRIQKFASSPEITWLGNGAFEGGSVALNFRASSAETPIGWAQPPSNPGFIGYTVYGGASPFFVAPTGAAEYRIQLPTSADATPTAYHSQSYMVVASLSSSPFREIGSPSESGFSADQVPPAVPTGTDFNFVSYPSQLSLGWLPNPAPDFAAFRVYRVPGVTLPPYTLIGTTMMNTFNTSSYQPGDSYAVTAVDDVGNESAFAYIIPNTVGVPAEPEFVFGLQGGWPNPASARTMTVRFSLADATPARLELIDVAGRVVEAREVGALGGGPQVVDLAPAGQVRSGIYFIRLTQGANTKSKRVTVLE